MLITSRPRHKSSSARSSQETQPVVKEPGRQPHYMKGNFNSRRRRPKTGPSHPTPPRVSVVSRRRKPHWVPAPAKSHKQELRDRASYPLCLVCDRQEHFSETYLDKLLDAMPSNDYQEDLPRDQARRSEPHAKVLQDLWVMDEKDHPQGTSLKWHDILHSDREANKKHHQKNHNKLKPPGEGFFMPIKSKSPAYPDEKDRKKREKTEQKRRKKNKGIQKKPALPEDNNNLTESLATKDIKKDKILAESSSKKQRELDKSLLLKCLEEIESKGCEILVKEPSAQNSSADISLTLSSSKVKNGKNGSNKNSIKDNNNDIFVSVVIDELKSENVKLKSDLALREEQLKKAADQIKVMVQENSRLANKLEVALSRAQGLAQDFDEEVQSQEQTHMRQIEILEQRTKELELQNQELLKSKNEDLGKSNVIRMLTEKLKEKDEANKNLQDYVNTLKESYLASFGSLASGASNLQD